MDADNRVDREELIVVTGASTGIGAATVKELAHRGFHILAGVRREVDAEALRGLPDRCRQILTLCKMYGHSSKEVAERMGISEHTVRAQIAIGIRRCAAYLRHRGVSATGHERR